jgi:hypothetical protein
MSNLISNCCGATPWLEETDLCSKCLDHAEFETEETESSQWFNDRVEASKLWIKCNVKQFGLGSARREMIKQGFTTDQVQRVSQILLTFN